jgi:homoserine kinase type II
MKSVIDWEFLGYKPEVYDLANLIGCVGFEDPVGLNEGFVMELISQTRRAATVSEPCWQVLPEWVVAIRFAWLSDWLRRRDREMIDLEVAYINLLVDNHQALKNFWGQAR